MRDFFEKLAPYLMDLVLAIVSYLTLKLSQWANSKKKESIDEIKNRCAQTAVQYAEQIGTLKSGPEKLQIATENLKLLLAEKDIKADDLEINILIESAVNLLNFTVWKEAPKPKFTKATVQANLVKLCNEENGYIGHDATSNLDKPKEYGRGGKYTKYARDLDQIHYFNNNKQGYSWCCVMICWLYYRALGLNKELTLKLLGQPESGNLAAGTGPLSRYLTEVKPHTINDVEIGDVVLYDYSDDGVADYDHVGIIYKKDAKWIYVAQGNATSIGPNGGFGINFVHGATHKNIQGIFRPHWDVLDK